MRARASIKGNLIPGADRVYVMRIKHINMKTSLLKLLASAEVRSIAREFNFTGMFVVKGGQSLKG